jgi:hypothetical protein
MRKFGYVGLMLAGSLACFTPAAVAQYAPVPPLRYEVRPPPPPGPRMVWQAGAWNWNGRGYDWIPGHYVAFRPHHHWAAGYWRGYGPHRVWVGPDWR